MTLAKLLAIAVVLALFPATAAARLPGVGNLQTACKVNWAHGLPGPDNKLDCTPGSFDRLKHDEVCTPKDHPSIRAADRREILSEYGKATWAREDGELDHRVPVFLGGRTVPENIWPEPGQIPNVKDKLETRVYRRVCKSDPFPMRVRTARRLFLADWRHTYRVWKADGIL